MWGGGELSEFSAEHVMQVKTSFVIWERGIYCLHILLVLQSDRD